MDEQISKKKKITIGLILSWIFGVLFALIGIVSIFSDPLPGFVMLIMAAVLFPPIVKLLNQKLKIRLSRGIKIAVVIIGFIIFGATVDTSSVSNTQKASEKNPAQEETSPKTETKEVKPEETSPKTETKEVKPEDEIKAIVNATLPGENNVGKNYIRNILVSGLPEEGYIVKVEFNPDENVSNHLTKLGIEQDMGKIYKALYYTYKGKITNVTISAFFPLEDKYGNVEDGDIYRTSLLKSEAEKVVWTTDETHLYMGILPGVWTIQYILPSFANE